MGIDYGLDMDEMLIIDKWAFMNRASKMLFNLKPKIKFSFPAVLKR